MKFSQIQTIFLAISSGLNAYFFTEIFRLKESLTQQNKLATLFQETTEKKICILEKLGETKNFSPKIEVLSTQSSDVITQFYELLPVIFGFTFVISISCIVVYASMPVIPTITNFFVTKIGLIFGTFPNSHSVVVKDLSTDIILGTFTFQQNIDKSISHIIYFPANETQQIFLNSVNFDAVIRSHMQLLIANSGPSVVQNGAEMVMMSFMG